MLDRSQIAVCFCATESSAFAVKNISREIRMSRNDDVFQATKGDGSVTWIGKVKWNVAPAPLFAVAHKRPPCDSTMERLMANPMPLPCGLVVKNAEKI